MSEDLSKICPMMSWVKVVYCHDGHPSCDENKPGLHPCAGWVATNRDVGNRGYCRKVFR